MMLYSTSKTSRRHVIRSLVGGSLLLPGILSELLADEAGSGTSPHPLAPKRPHFEPKAQRVILLFSSGGVSHMDTFDHKPKLFAADKATGKEVAAVKIPGKTSAVPMTFMHKGKQYIVFATGSGANTSLVALALPGK